MALGTTLSSALDVSTTIGVQSLSFTGGGFAIVDALIGSGSLTVCVMGYHHDYSNNAPTQDGDHTQIRVYFAEATGVQRPSLVVEQDTGVLTSTLAESSGNDDDAYIYNVTFDGTVSWDTIRGDETTTGTTRNDAVTYSYTAIYARKMSGRGGAVITDCRRSYFVFDLSGMNATRTYVDANLNLRLDNLGHTNDDFGKIIAVEATALAGTTADFGNCFVADAVAVTHNATFFGANF